MSKINDWRRGKKKRVHLSKTKKHRGNIAALVAHKMNKVPVSIPEINAATSTAQIMSDEEVTPNPLPSTSEIKPTQTTNTGALVVAEDKTSDEYIRLRVITSDTNNEVHFRVKATTNLGRLKRSYCGKLGFQVEDLRFVFDGYRITDEDTPKKLGMVNDDVIEIYQERTGGMNKCKLCM